MIDITQYLENHPRMIGVLFTVLLLLSQAGSAAATNASLFQGP